MRRALLDVFVCVLLLATGVLIATCGPTNPTEPTVYAAPAPAVTPAPGPSPEPTPPPQPALPDVTLTLAPSVATVTSASADTILCISAPSDPYLGMPPGAYTNLCQTVRGWQTLQVIR